MTLKECIAYLEDVINRPVIYNGSMVRIDYDHHLEAIDSIKQAREALSFMRMVDRGETNI